MFEPILWFTKPYKIGSTITDNILKNNLGALNPVITSNILKIGYDKKERGLHEAQKPLKLMETIIKLTTIENQLILDPFMGSGTTGVACKNLNRHFIGIELDENYFNIAKERIENA